MRYLIDAEFRQPTRASAKPPAFPYATNLRRELSERNLRWALAQGHAHEVGRGTVPAILYREDETGSHGNFLPAAYRRIKQTPSWNRRLAKVHTSARRTLLSHDPHRCELDSCNSSDALLMNFFCHPSTLAAPAVRQLLGLKPGVASDVKPVFGHRPRIPLLNGRGDCTEVDMTLGDLLVEAKLTEYDFQTAPRRLIDRYRDLETVFHTDLLGIECGIVPSYQLIRSVLAAYAAPGLRFCVICDRRRPDLIDAWHRVMTAVRPYDLRCRLQLLTWQELAAAMPAPFTNFLNAKYGLCPSRMKAIGRDAGFSDN